VDIRDSDPERASFEHLSALVPIVSHPCGGWLGPSGELVWRLYQERERPRLSCHAAAARRMT